jgi:hypothetical protein
VEDSGPRHLEALIGSTPAPLDRLCGERFRDDARRARAIARADPGLAERSARSLGL